MTEDRPTADGIVSTELERRSLEELRRASGEVDGPMERHCVRCFLLVEQLAAKRGLTIDREVALSAAFLHDIGLYDAVSHGGVYTDEGGELARSLFADAGETAERATLVADACAYHHALRDQSSRGAEVELLRLADRIEVSGGTIRSGLSGREVGDIFEAVPRDGFYKGVAALVGHVLRTRPLTMPRVFRLSR